MSGMWRRAAAVLLLSLAPCAGVATAQRVPPAGPRQPMPLLMAVPKPDAWFDIGGVAGVATLHYGGGTSPTLLGGFSSGGALAFPWLTVGISADIWELAPTHAMGGHGADVVLTLAKPIESVAGLELRGGVGYGFDELASTSRADAPTGSHDGLVFRFGIARERRYEAGKGIVYSAELLTGNVGGGVAPVLRFPVLQVGIAFRGHRSYSHESSHL